VKSHRFDRWFNYDFIKIWGYCAQLGFFPFCGRNDNSTGIAHPERLFQIDDRPEGTHMKKTGSGSGGMAQWVELISEWALFILWTAAFSLVKAKFNHEANLTLGPFTKVEHRVNLTLPMGMSINDVRY